MFAKIKDKYGSGSANSISYISTGPDCWVHIYTQNRLMGRHQEITPLQNIDLTQVVAGDNPDQESFNDNILSGTIRSTDSSHENPDSDNTKPSITPIAIWYSFSGSVLVDLYLKPWQLQPCSSCTHSQELQDNNRTLAAGISTIKTLLMQMSMASSYAYPRTNTLHTPTLKTSTSVVLFLICVSLTLRCQGHSQPLSVLSARPVLPNLIVLGSAMWRQVPN